MPPPRKKRLNQPLLPEVELGATANYVSRPTGMPTLDTLKTELARLGLPASDAEHLYDVWLSNGFRTKVGKIRSWTAAVRNWYRNGWFPSQKKEAQTKPPERWLTRERVVARLTKLGWTRPKLIDYAWGKLMNGRYYGRLIENDEDLRAAILAIGTEFDRDNQ